MFRLFHVSSYEQYACVRMTHTPRKSYGFHSPFMHVGLWMVRLRSDVF